VRERARARWRAHPLWPYFRRARGAALSRAGPPPPATPAPPPRRPRTCRPRRRTRPSQGPLRRLPGRRPPRAAAEEADTRMLPAAATPHTYPARCRAAPASRPCPARPPRPLPRARSPRRSGGGARPTAHHGRPTCARTASPPRLPPVPPPSASAPSPRSREASPASWYEGGGRRGEGEAARQQQGSAACTSRPVSPPCVPSSHAPAGRGVRVSRLREDGIMCGFVDTKAYHIRPSELPSSS